MQLTVIMAIKRDLLQILDKYYNDEELKDLCFRLADEYQAAADLQYDNLGGEGKADKARELIRYMERRGLLRELALTIQVERPDVAVPIPEAAKPAPSSVQKLNRVALVVGLGALALVVAVVVLLRREGGLTSQPVVTPTFGPPVTNYAVALSVADGCPEAWPDELKEGIAATVNGATPERPITFDAATDEANLVLNLSCEGDVVVWKARFMHPAPIFEIVGSPQEISLRLPAPEMLDLGRLGRALIYYGRNDYALAEEPFSRLTVAFDALELHWLYANTLLLTEQYEPSVAAYTNLIARAEGDTLALIYANRALAHMDQVFRLEMGFQMSQEEKQLVRDDLAQALAVPPTSAEAVALVNSDFGVASALLNDPGASMAEAVNACHHAVASQRESAWAQVCQAAVLIEPLKFRPPSCETDLFAEASELLSEAERLRPELAATYFWQGEILYSRNFNCSPPTVEGDFETLCHDRNQRLATLIEADLAPLVLHQYLHYLFPFCAA